MFFIDDEIHCELQKERYESFDDAVAELLRRASIPWDKPPNLAPCTSWRTCGRVYEIVEYDVSVEPWMELHRVPFLKIKASGIQWLRPIN